MPFIVRGNCARDANGNCAEHSPPTPLQHHSSSKHDWIASEKSEQALPQHSALMSFPRRRESPPLIHSMVSSFSHRREYFTNYWEQMFHPYYRSYQLSITDKSNEFIKNLLWLLLLELIL